MIPNWIKQNGIRAGFVQSTNGVLTVIPQYVELMKSIHLNTAIIYGCSFAETPNHLRYYREWIKQCKAAGLRVFAFYPWQPPAGNTCRPVVFADGTIGKFPCPQDETMWQNYHTRYMMLLAKENIDGIFLDMEMYRTESLEAKYRRYSDTTCYCEVCKRRSVKGVVEVLKRITLLRGELLNIRPDLAFGVYPTPPDSNWVQEAVMMGLESVISFSTETYGYYAKPWGADRIPSDIPGYFNQRSVGDGVYCPGYLFRAYKPDDLATQIRKSIDKVNGYWLFNINQLITGKDLAGTAEEYKKALKGS